MATLKTISITQFSITTTKYLRLDTTKKSFISLRALEIQVHDASISSGEHLVVLDITLVRGIKRKDSELRTEGGSGDFPPDSPSRRSVAVTTVGTALLTHALLKTWSIVLNQTAVLTAADC